MAYVNTNVNTPNGPDWIQNLPKLAPEAAPVADKGNWLTAGVTTGLHQAVGQIGSAEQAVGALTGWQGLRDYGKSVADNRAKLAAASGRPDLEAGGEQGPWSLPGIGYQLAKAAPAMAAMVGAGMAVPGSAVPAALGRFGASVPGILGGGGSLAGEAAAAAGSTWAKHVFGAGVAGFPFMAGGNVQEYEKSHPGEQLGPGAAAASLALAAPEAAIGGLAPTAFRAPVAGDLARRLITGATQGAAIQAPAAALQAGLTGIMDPNKNPTDRAKDIVDAALGGALVGGAYGGGFRAFQKAKPEELNNNKALIAATDQLKPDQSAGEPPPPPLALPAPPNAGMPAGAAPPNPKYGPFATLPEADLRAQIEPLAAKGAERSPEENTQHGLLQQELASRTPPGLPVGEGNLATPEEQAQRIPAAEAFAKEHDLPEEFTRGRLITSEPELVNQANSLLNEYAENTVGKPPKYLQDIADKYALNGTPIDEQITAQVAKVAEIGNIANRNPGMADKARAEVRELHRLQGLEQVHNDAAELLKQQSEPRPPAAAEVASAPAEPAPAVEVPDKLKDTPAAEHWDAMTRLAATDSDDAATAKTLAQTIEESTGKTQQKAIRQAKKLAADPDNAELLAKPAEAVQGEPPPVAEEPPLYGAMSELAKTYQAVTGEEHPLIKDGSTFDSVPPAERAPIAPVLPSPADHIADVQSAQREEAKRIASGDQKKDPFAKAAQAALDREANPKKKSDGGAVANFLNVYQNKMEEANPEGPFTKAESPVVGTANVPAEHVGFVRDLMDAHGLSGIRVMMLHPDDVMGDRGDAHALFGSYASARNAPDIIAANPGKDGHIVQFGPEGKDFAVYVKPGMTDAQTLSAYGHEVGHIVDKVQLSNASKTMQNAVNNQFWLDTAAKYNLTKQDVARLKRNQATTESALGTMDPHGATGLPDPLANIAQLKGEWFADKVAQWTLSDQKPRSAVDNFFKSLYKNWQSIVAKVTGNPLPSNDEVAKFLNTDRTNLTGLWQGSLDRAPQFKTSEPQGPQTVPDMNNAAKTASNGADSIWERASKLFEEQRVNILPRIRGSITGLWWVPREVRARVAESIGMPSIKQQGVLSDMRSALSDKVNQTLWGSTSNLYKMPPDMAKTAQLGMRLMADHGLDMRLPFDQQRDLHNHPNVGQLREIANAAHDAWKVMKQKEGGIYADVYNDAITANKLQSMLHLAATQQRAIETYNKFGTVMPDVKNDVLDRFQMSGELHDDVNKALPWLTAEIAANAKQIDTHLGTIGDAAAAETDPARAEATRRTADELNFIQKLTADKLAQVDQPYFHAARIGNHFVGAKIALDEKGQPRQDAVASIQKAMDDVGLNLAMSPAGESGRFFSRVQTHEQMMRLGKVILEQQKLGNIDPKEEVVHGDPRQLDAMMKLAPQAVQEYVNRLNAVPAPEGASDLVKQAYADANARVKEHAIRSWLDMYSDNNIHKVNVEKTDVQGSNRDMFQNMAVRNQMTAHAVATAAYSGRMADITQQMRNEVQAAKVLPTDGRPVDWDRATRMQDYANEAVANENTHPYDLHVNGWDVAQRYAHAVIIGMNPAYVVTVMSQIPLLNWPELSKYTSHMNSAKALAEATNPAFTALMATLKNNMHFGMSEAALKATGKLTDKQVRDLITQDNLGNITTSSWTRTQSEIAAGADPTKIQQRNWTNVMGYGAEIFPRMQATLAAAKIYDAMTPEQQKKLPGRDDFIGSVIKGANQEWGPGSSARAVGKMGMAGPMSPLMLQFTQFQSRMIGKYYTEMRALMGKESPAAAKAAGRFLAGHLVATMAIAGTMGMPGAGWFAGAADRIGGALTGRDDFDVNAAYRNWLTDVFGQGMGEVMAKGLPTAAGVDLSHVGGQHLLPFTDMIANKRKLEDAAKDWTKSMAGSGIGLGLNMAVGARDLVNGNYMDGLQKIIPGAFHAPLAAYRMGTYGYEDRNGIKLPMTPGASDILMTALGFKPADKALYDDKEKTFQGLEAMREYHKGIITHQAEISYAHGDMAGYRAAMQNAAQYARNNPGVGSGMVQAVGNDVSNVVQKAAKAKGLGTPIGVELNDPVARSLFGHK